MSNGLLFRDLWLRPDLAPRDRSLVTVSALIASGQVWPLSYHLNRAMGPRTHPGAGRGGGHTWPSMLAGPSLCQPCRSWKEVFAKRP